MVTNRGLSSVPWPARPLVWTHKLLPTPEPIFDSGDDFSRNVGVWRFNGLA